METAPSHVLVVDDDAAVCSLVSEYLSQNDSRVTAVGSGKQMTDVLAAEAIDLIVLDLKLRGEDGLQLARRLRESSKIPIIMVTARTRGVERTFTRESAASARKVASTLALSKTRAREECVELQCQSA